jgi:hypothetical protein
MAMGRDVLDNVTVAVVQTGAGKTPRRWLWAAVGSAALLGILGFAAAILAPRPSATPAPESIADLGYAVLVGGSASSVSADGTTQSVANLGTIPGGQRLIALSNLRLSLQSRSVAASDIPTLSFYLSQGGSLVLSSLDAGGASSATTVSLESGELLMTRSGGSRNGWIEAAGREIGFAGTGAGSVAVSLRASRATVDCLVGRCSVRLGTDQVELLAPSELVLEGGTSAGPLSLPTEAIRAWNDLCGGCIPAP